MKRSHFKKGVSRCGHRILEDPFPVRAARTTQANNTFSLRDLFKCFVENRAKS